jgi:hypothetical protein
MELTSIPLEYILKAAKSVKRLAYLIAVIGAVTSFGTQVELLESWSLTPAFAWGIAATVDILAICAAIALQVPGFPDRTLVGWILVIALSASITANIIAGLKVGGGAAAAHAWPVLAYMLAELIASRLRNYVARVQAAKNREDAPKPVEVPASPVHATATVTRTPTKAIAGKPGTAKQRILELATAAPRPTDEEIAVKVGVKPGWVKHVVKTHLPTS